MNNEETAQALTFLQDTWTQREMRTNTAKIWGVELSRFDYAEVMRSLLSLARTSEFRPSLATIIKSLASPNELAPSAAFHQVMCSLIQPRSLRAAYLTAATQETIRRMGGWAAVGRWDVGERHWREKDFIRVYAEVCESGEASALAAIGEVKLPPVAAGLTAKLLKAKRSSGAK